MIPRSAGGFRLGLLALATILTVSGCGGGSGDASAGTIPTPDGNLAVSTVLGAAKDEGSVVWYTSIPEAAVNDVITGFSQTFGIHVEVVRFPSATLMQRYTSERAAGQSQADVINVAESAFFETNAAKGWFADLSTDEVPSLADWPEEFRPAKHYVMTNTQPIGITVNTDIIAPEKVAGWETLLDERFKGKFVLVNPSNSPFYLAWLQMLQKEYGEDFLSSLKAQSMTVVDSAVPGSQQVAAGEDAVMAPAVLSGSLGVQKEGAPIATVFPSPTVGVEQYAAAIADGPHPHAAKIFMNYLMSRAGQELFNRGYAASPLKGIPGSLPLPSDYRRADAQGALAAKAGLLKAVGL